MTNYTSFDELWNDLESQESFQIEEAILNFSIQLNQLMKKRNISKSEFATKLGKSSAYITKVFRGNANFTLASMVKLVKALDGHLNIHITGTEDRGAVWYKVITRKKVMPHNSPIYMKNCEPTIGTSTAIRQSTPLTQWANKLEQAA